MYTVLRFPFHPPASQRLKHAGCVGVKHYVRLFIGWIPECVEIGRCGGKKLVSVSLTCPVTSS